MLGGWGCRVRTATGLTAALAEAESGAPDLILADVHLNEGEDGFACVQAVRQRLRHPVPAALITADRSAVVKERAESLGLPLLNKPIRPAALRTLMRRLTNARPAAE
jgi:CheY-like chemotaxis protein